MKPSRSRRRSRRAPIVITGTALGLAGVLSFRSMPATVSLAGISAAATTSTTVAGASPPSTSTPTTTAAPTTPTTVAHSAAPPTTVATTSPPTTAAATTRSATGPVVNYYFGTVSVKVTATGSKIDSVSIASLNDGGNPRSQYIDQQALPTLVQQAMVAQSANIQGVSGATYTSQGFYTSLSAALKSLGLA